MIDTSTLYQANRKVKLEGTIFGSLTVEKYLGSRQHDKCAIYSCRCQCGSELILPQSHLAPNSRCRQMCNDCMKAITHENSVKVKHKRAYKSWCKIKERCFNKDEKSYYLYGAVGISMSDTLRYSFESFLREVGDPPSSEGRWSIDRIDNTLGYVEGNLRWATPFQQARNKGKARNNTTGVTGVNWDVKQFNGSCPVLYAKAQWKEIVNGKQLNKTKSFSTNKLGLLPAFAAACKYREDKIRELNTQGYGYSETHGKEKQ